MLADTIIFLFILKTTMAIFILDFLEVLLALSYLCMLNFTFSFPQKAYMPFASLQGIIIVYKRGP